MIHTNSNSNLPWEPIRTPRSGRSPGGICVYIYVYITHICIYTYIHKHTCVYTHIIILHTNSNSNLPWEPIRSLAARRATRRARLLRSFIIAMIVIMLVIC